MGAGCSRRGPLLRSGATQADRVLSELDPGHAPLDERSLGDLQVYAQRYARRLRYYELDGTSTNADGDPLTFEPFFAHDPSAVFASIERIPVAAYRSLARTLRVWLVSDPPPSTVAMCRHASLLFRLPILLLSDLGERLDRLPSSDALRSRASILAERELGEPLRRLLRFEKGSRKPHNDVDLLDEGVLDPGWYRVNESDAGPGPLLPRVVADALAGAPKLADTPIDGGLLERVVGDGFGKLYTRDTHSSAQPGTPPDSSPFSASGSKRADLRAAMSYGALPKSIEQVFHAVEQISLAASELHAESLTADDHDAQYALWLTFCRLFATQQEDLNRFTARHREFYYKKVLGLSPRDPTPDSAHLLVELKKSVEQHKLAVGTGLRGGKDDKGVEVTYTADRDTVLNRGVVEELRAMFRPVSGADGVARAFASSAVNSGDGAGAELPEDEPAWPPFGSQASPPARIGFAIADRKLFLREGTRTITVTAALSAAPAAGSITPGAFRARLTGEEEWVQAGVTRATVTTNTDSSATLELVVEVTPEQPAIVPRDPELHGEEFGSQLPVMVVEMTLGDDTDDDTPAATALGALESLGLSGIELRVDASGLRRFTASSDQGVLDTTKPFTPFGSQPRAGGAFVLGSAEVFSKPISTLTLEFEWQDSLDHYSHYHKDKASAFTAKAWRLDAGAWAEHPPELEIFGVESPLPWWIFELPTYTELILATPQLLAPVMPIQIALQNPALGKAVIGGMPRTVAGGVSPGATEEIAFGATVKRYAIAAQPELAEPEALLGIWESESNFPPSTRQSVPIDLADVPDPGAAQTLEDPVFATSSVAGFMRLSLTKDFGHGEYIDKRTYALIRVAQSGSNWEGKDSDINYSDGVPKEPYTPTLVSLTLRYDSQAGAPAEFYHVHPFGYEAVPAPDRLLPSYPDEGELYIGVAGLKPPCALTLLVRVAPGTANPLKSLAEVAWEYLDGNTWLPVETAQLDDGTSELADTGIVTISVQAACDEDHTVLPGGLSWFRLRVAADADAANDLLGVDAQAIRVTFADNGNDPQFLATPLPAGTISKLEQGDASVKSIDQPDESFGGAPAEDDDSFAVRVSGRLRHKDRASTMWDYERLVLDAFPGVYRVKCLPHTALCAGSDGGPVADNELKPGGVVVVPVPYVSEGGPIDPLRPYADTATRSKIKAFLQARVSPFVGLEVQNPRIERVRFEADVAFKPEVTDRGFAITELIAALVDFLTPWASRGADIAFGGVWHKASVINFLEEQPGVDYLKNVRMLHGPDPEGGYLHADLETVRATTARSILVSADTHKLEILKGS